MSWKNIFRDIPFRCEVGSNCWNAHYRPGNLEKISSETIRTRSSITPHAENCLLDFLFCYISNLSALCSTRNLIINKPATTSIISPSFTEEGESKNAWFHPTTKFLMSSGASTLISSALRRPLIEFLACLPLIMLWNSSHSFFYVIIITVFLILILINSMMPLTCT